MKNSPDGLSNVSFENGWLAYRRTDGSDALLCILFLYV